MATLLSRWAPPLALMALTFYLSDQPHLSTGLGVWDLILRKAAHMTEFGLLWFLWWRALGYGARWPAVVITLAYAATDEYHQTFVAGRHGSPVDWAIDAVGVAIAIAIAGRLRASRARWR
jgi:VanZ family protein